MVFSWTLAVLAIFLMKNIFVSTKVMTTIACEDDYISLECTSGNYINIWEANYGRTSVEQCGVNSSVVNCVESSTLSVMQSFCESGITCSVLASLNVFGDPCPGVPKYLSVTYECVNGITDSDTTTVVTTTADYMTSTTDRGTTLSSIDGKLGSVTTSTILQSTNPSSSGIVCGCDDCQTRPGQYTSEDLASNPQIVEEITRNITAELKINKKTLSSAKRKITSAPDNRVSASFVGYIGVGVLTVVFGLVVLADLTNIIIPCLLGRRGLLYDNNV